MKIKELTVAEAEKVARFNKMFGVRVCAYGIIIAGGTEYCIKAAKHCGEHWVVKGEGSTRYWEIINDSD